MRLLEALGADAERPSCRGGGLVVGVVGGGGKTASLFALAEDFAERGDLVLLGTTTHIRDPRREPGRRFEAFVLDPALGSPPGPEARVLAAELCFALSRPAPNGGSSPRGAVLVAGPSLVGPGSRAGSPAGEAATVEEAPRLGAIHPGWAELLAELFGVVLLECDGSRGLPIKAPAGHEPVLPGRLDLVLGLVGLDALASSIEGGSVHRPELLAGLLGKRLGDRLHAEDLAKLALHPSGLFKSSPPEARRVLVLNKADLAGEEAAAKAFADIVGLVGEAESGRPGADGARRAPDLVLLAELGAAGAEHRVRDLARPRRARSPASPAAP